MGDLSAGRRHYERRVSQARATRKPVTRKSVEQATMLELLAMSEWYEPSEQELMGGLMFEEWMLEPDPVIDIVVSRDGNYKGFSYQQSVLDADTGRLRDEFDNTRRVYHGSEV